MAEIIGGHRVFGHSMLWASVLTMFTPAASFIDYKALVVVRALLGLMLGTIDTVKLTLTLIASNCLLLLCVCLISPLTGASWPAIHPMTAVWIPPVDRSKFMANMMASSLGAAITMPICGFLIEYVNWQSVFYVTGKHETNMIEFVRNS